MQNKILVVDDYEDARSFLRVLLEGYGHQVVEANNGIEAVNCFKLHHPHLILMDISMPLMDGLTATKNIRSLKEGAKIPIIAVTAFTDNFQERVTEAGCDCMIYKPIDFDIFEPTLNKYLIH